MMLSGQISIEITVSDFVEAADHQKRIESLLARVRDVYPDATLAMRERRQKKPRIGPLPPRAERFAAHGEA